MEELKNLMKAYHEEVGHVPELLGLALSARKNLCIHPEVIMGMGISSMGIGILSRVLGMGVLSMESSVAIFCQVSKEEEGKSVDSKCHKLTASFQRKKHQRDHRVPVCGFYEVPQ